MKRRDKLSFLYSLFKDDVREMFWLDATKKVVCVLSNRYFPSKQDEDWKSGFGYKICHIGWTYFKLKIWVVPCDQKEHWKKIKERAKPNPEEIYGITAKKQIKGKLVKLKAKR